MAVIIGPGAGIPVAEISDSVSRLYWGVEDDYLYLNDTNAAGKRIEIWYSKLPEPLASSTNITSTDSEFRDADVFAIVYGICARIAEKLTSEEVATAFRGKQRLEEEQIINRNNKKKWVAGANIKPARM